MLLYTAGHLLVHVLIAGATMAGGIVLIDRVEPWRDSGAARLALLFGMPLVATVFGSWPLYRLFNLRPLILPLCPRCRDVHENYHLPRGASHGLLVCGSCGQPFTLYVAHLTEDAPVMHESQWPVLEVVWPRWLGLWRLSRASRTGWKRPDYNHPGTQVYLEELSRSEDPGSRLAAVKGMAGVDAPPEILVRALTRVLCDPDLWVGIAAGRTIRRHLGRDPEALSAYQRVAQELGAEQSARIQAIAQSLSSS